MGTAKHYPLSASAAPRWVLCPGSVEFQKLFADNTSDVAERGTKIHAYAEAHMNLRPFEIAEAAKGLTQGDIDVAMEYVAYCTELAKGRECVTEFRVELTPYLGGTMDFAAFDADELHVVDLKTGRISVQAKDNAQLILYAAGMLAYIEDEFFLAPHTVHLHIVQPHDGAPKMATYNTSDIVETAHAIMLRAKNIHEGTENFFAAGEHCRYCRAGFFCQTRIEKLGLDLVEAGAVANTLQTQYDPEKVAYYAIRVDQFKKELDALYQFAHGLALAGQPLPGTKLVAGRATRYYVDQTAIAERLIGAGFDRALIYKTPELVGLTDMESLVGKKKFATLSEGLIDKKQGAPKLVGADAKGEDFNSGNVFQKFV